MIRRKLQEVLRDLAPLEKQGKVEGFFNNSENAAQLVGLVEGIRDAMMEYQVCTSNCSSPLRLIPSQTSLQQGIYDKQQGIYDQQQGIFDQQQGIYAKQQDIDNKVGVIMVNFIPSPFTPTV